MYTMIDFSPLKTYLEIFKVQKNVTSSTVSMKTVIHK